MKASREEILTEIKFRLGDRIVDFFDRSAKRVFVEVGPSDIPETSRLVFEELGARLQIASGVDTPLAIEILYHWAFDHHGFVISVRTKLSRDNPVVESIAGICKGAEWIEREMAELLGIEFKNHPDPRRLLLNDDWPEGKFPLRRDFKQEKKED